MRPVKWSPLFTNTFDESGNVVWTNTMGLNTPQQFYLIQVP
jgi:hypothetical protein